jgi:hypothetical protein
VPDREHFPGVADSIQRARRKHKEISALSNFERSYLRRSNDGGASLRSSDNRLHRRES